MTDALSKTVADLAETTKAAGRLAIAEARKAKLVNITLPAAYLALGRDIFTDGRFRSEFPAIYAEIESTQLEIARLTTGREIKIGEDFWERSRKAALNLKDTAQAKSQALRADSLMRRLGKEVYTAHGENSGSGAIIIPVSRCLSEIEKAEVQIRQESAVRQGRWVTPARLLCGSLGVLALVVSMAVYNKPQEAAHVVQDAAQPSLSAPSSGEKLRAFREVVQVFSQHPDEYASSEEREAFTRRLRAVQQKYSAIPFDPTKDRDQAKQIIQVFRDQLEKRYSGLLYREIEDEIMQMYEKMIQ
jgi:hypothetical protein